MSMSKKDFIALADAIRDHDHYVATNAEYRTSDNNSTLEPQPYTQVFTPDQLFTLARFLRRSNPNFMPRRWLSYIAGECGPNGGPIKVK